MWPPFVVIPSPVGDDPSCFKQILEPADAKALLSQLAVEALHVGVLRGLARLDVDQIDLAIQSPGEEVATGQFRAVVTANGSRQAALGDDLVEHTRNAQAREARVYLHGKALACVRVDYVQYTDRAARGHCVMHEVERPLLVSRCIYPQRGTHAHAVLAPLAA